MNKYGIYICFPPGVDLRHEGLGRYLAAFIKGAEKKENGFSIDLTLMEQGKVYNVPAECWFYSITQKDTKIVYVQDSNCSMENSDFCDLSEEEIAWIQEKASRLLA